MNNIVLDQPLEKNDFEIIGFEEDDLNRIVRPTVSYWQDAWRRLRENPVAMTSLAVLCLLVIMVIIGPSIRGLDYVAMKISLKNKPSSPEFWFGTDGLGRDLFSRVWVGARASIIIAIVATSLKIMIGTLYGAFMAHFGGAVDEILMRIIELINSIPNMLVTIMIMMVLGNSLLSLLVALSVVSWCNTARQVRGMIKQLKESEYILAAEALGVKPMRLIIRHYVPNMLGILILDASTAIPGFIFTEAGLSFLGIGLKSPDISLGVLISMGQQSMDFYPYQLFFPCLVLCVLVMAFNLLGDGLRNALDPKMRA